jgi:hypothetical protein
MKIRKCREKYGLLGEKGIQTTASIFDAERIP